MNSAALVQAAPAPAQTRAETPARAASLDWTSPAIVFGSLCITIGIMWDISWHATIGRDTFWTPAHMMIYLGGTLGGCLAGWLTLHASFFRRAQMTGATVGLWGFRAPLGAWVCIWGSVAMLTSAPFDDWWHSAYGLDVKILSPPHAILALGMYGVAVGATLLAASARNRARDAGEGSRGVFLVVAAFGIQLALASVLLMEQSFPNQHRNATFALASAAMYPTFLIAAARFAPTRWAATKVALVYTAIQLFMVWVLPLFPAEPKLAPIFNRVTHMAPPAFPLLLVLPAFAIDVLFLALQRRSHWSWNLLRIAAAATLFVAVFLPAQWFFAKFLISPAADNWFFAGYGRFFGYMAEVEWRDKFWRLERDPLTAAAVGWTWLIALGTATLGLGVGIFLARVRR